MKILHYSLGLPPYRAGGLTKYCMDLMHAQKKAGHEVELLWPGRMTDKETKIKKKKKKYDIVNYEIINPLPVSLLGGIKDVEAFTKPCEINVFLDFLKEEKYEVIHLHTLMGLAVEFLEAAKRLGIKLVFTTHDYFGICPTCSLMIDDELCTVEKQCNVCGYCNRYASSKRKIEIKQGLIYRNVKKLKIAELLKKHVKRKQIVNYKADSNTKDYSKYQNRYEKLKKYYYEMFEMMDVIHFNSSITQGKYREFGVNGNSKVINISNRNISDHREKKNFSGKLKIGYLNQISIRKGFYVLKEALDSLSEDYKEEFELHIFSKNITDSSYIVDHKAYTNKQLGDVMNSLDVVVLPSIWPETFGFTILEALSYGVPVIVSDNVGAKDLIKNGNNGYVYNSKEELEKILKEIIVDRKILSNINENILADSELLSMEKHANDIMELYTGLLS